jgi:hypothetical protein
LVRDLGLRRQRRQRRREHDGSEQMPTNHT